VWKRGENGEGEEDVLSLPVRTRAIKLQEISLKKTHTALQKERGKGNEIMGSWSMVNLHPLTREGRTKHKDMEGVVGEGPTETRPSKERCAAICTNRASTSKKIPHLAKEDIAAKGSDSLVNIICNVGKQRIHYPLRAHTRGWGRRF